MALPAGSIPTPEDVHALVATRPTFTATSRPSRPEVLVIINNKAAEVDVEITEDAVLPADLIVYTKAAISYGAAADIEASFFPEQQFGDGGAARSLSATYLRMLQRLLTRLGAASTAGTAGFTISPSYVPDTF